MNMLRVFKVTSPMSIGSWVLLVSGGASNDGRAARAARPAEAVKLARRGGRRRSRPAARDLHRRARLGHRRAGLARGRHELPWIFGASAAASAGAAASMLRPPEGRGPGAAARRSRASLAEGALMQAMELRLGKRRRGRTARATAGKLSWAAKGLCDGGRGAARAARPEEPRARRCSAARSCCAGELCLRWAVFKAGFQSARDPKYVVESQRQRVEQRGTKATTKPGDGPRLAAHGALMLEHARLTCGRARRRCPITFLGLDDRYDRLSRATSAGDPAEADFHDGRLAGARRCRCRCSCSGPPGA